MMPAGIEAIVPTIEGREELLARALAGFALRGVEVQVVRGHGTLGEGWQTGIERSHAEILWLVADDVYPYWPAWRPERLTVALERAEAGLVVCPPLYWDSGVLQGSGGHGDSLADGMNARNCAFPLAHRDTFALLGEVPPFNHNQDVWLTGRAAELGRGPVVTAAVPLVHSVLTDPEPWEDAAFDAWRAGRTAAG